MFLEKKSKSQLSFWFNKFWQSDVVHRLNLKCSEGTDAPNGARTKIGSMNFSFADGGWVLAISWVVKPKADSTWRKKSGWRVDRVGDWVQWIVWSHGLSEVCPSMTWQQSGEKQKQKDGR